MIIKDYVFDKIKVSVKFVGQYFINKEGRLSHTSAKLSMEDFETYVFTEE